MIITGTRTIHVTFQRAGLHCYPGAAPEVKYLSAPHRHLFKFQVNVDVEHNDRDIEFHTLLNELEGQYDTGLLQLNNKSCEMIAEELALYIVNKYNRTTSVSVWEDGECGATVSFSVM